MDRSSGLLFFLFFAVLLTLGIACKKDSKAAKTKTQLITSGSWKISSLTVNPALDYNGDGTTETDIFALFDACSKDDVTTFKTNGTATNDEGATKCDPNDPQTSSVKWLFNTDETKITIDGVEYTITSLTETEFKCTNNVDDAGTTHVETVTFVHS